MGAGAEARDVYRSMQKAAGANSLANSFHLRGHHCRRERRVGREHLCWPPMARSSEGGAGVGEGGLRDPSVQNPLPTVLEEGENETSISSGFIMSHMLC